MFSKKIKILAKSICQDATLRENVTQLLKVDESVFADPEKCRDLDYLHHYLEGCEAAIIGHQQIDNDFLQKMTSLRRIAKYGVGLDNIDFAACESHKVEVLWKPGVNRDFVAEHALGLMIASRRNLALSDRDVRDGNWHRNGGVSMFGKTVGIVGFGAVGTALASLLQSFNIDLLVDDIIDKSDEAKKLGGQQVKLHELLSRSDIVSVHVPLTEWTSKFVDTAWFEKMKDDALFINTSRGEVVDESALCDFLEINQNAAACCDVFAEEPTRNFALIRRPNFLATPHIAANCVEAKMAMTSAACALILS